MLSRIQYKITKQRLKVKTFLKAEKKKKKKSRIETDLEGIQTMKLLDKFNECD